MLEMSFNQKLFKKLDQKKDKLQLMDIIKKDRLQINKLHI